MRYYIIIDKNKNCKYRFQLFYCGKKEMGYSKEYDDIDNCIKGFREFKDFIKNNKITDEGKYLKMFEYDNKYFIYQFFDENNNILYTSRKIENKVNCIKSMKSTCKNIINAEIKQIKR